MFLLKVVLFISSLFIYIAATAQKRTSYESLQNFLQDKVWIRNDCLIDICRNFFYTRQSLEGNHKSSCINWTEVCDVSNFANHRFITIVPNALIRPAKRRIIGEKTVYSIKYKTSYVVYHGKRKEQFVGSLVIDSDSSFTIEGQNLESNKSGVTYRAIVPSRALWEYLR